MMMIMMMMIVIIIIIIIIVFKNVDWICLAQDRVICGMFGAPQWYC
jgi:hypothetical protein